MSIKEAERTKEMKDDLIYQSVLVAIVDAFFNQKLWYNQNGSQFLDSLEKDKWLTDIKDSFNKNKDKKIKVS